MTNVDPKTAAPIRAGWTKMEFFGAFVEGIDEEMELSDESAARAPTTVLSSETIGTTHVANKLLSDGAKSCTGGTSTPATDSASTSPATTGSEALLWQRFAAKKVRR